MEIIDLQPNRGSIDLVFTIIEKGDVRNFEKFGRAGRVCTAKVKDDSGEVVLTLWNEDIDKVDVGDQVHLKNGWCSEFKGEKQLSAGKFGKIEIIKKAAEQKEVLTNDPSILQQQAASEESSPEEDDEPVQEEFIE